MNTLFLLLILFSGIDAGVLGKTESKASKDSPQYYLMATLNGNERSIFHVTVDEYERFVYKGCTTLFSVFYEIVYAKSLSMKSNATYIQLHAVMSTGSTEEEVTVRSVPKLYTGSMVQNSAFKVLTAVITLNKGTLYSITWDDGCHTCFPASCRQNSVLDDGGVTIIQPSDELGAYAGENCFETQSTCSDNPDSCDLQIFVGHVLQSANLRLSRFQSGSIESAINNL
ncbi:hypothetical protein JH06_3184 [Blastocystis sp. subtype 4]|uniref:hypothetical protein n=1 Tax=Blastocystis sp. subtype 4 TaxID=944170 RepID=UPI0007115369|nr:hypothetical protein JH06_3184 [Blastocystis sp. subtype 4]KNB44708.1 hypothetical protein JH06_3184 [Blastocystis sp. subtype 4]|eukprot:XP_014528151.1 hypothetical protein JH06_3184 [Blastocystis sp. subtype 4]